MIELQEKLLDTEEAMLRVRQVLAEHPDDAGLLINFQSLERRASRLQDEFAAAASELGIDVCSYRIFADDRDQPTLRGLVAALGTFQNLFSIVYEALKSGPKRTARLGEPAIRETAFGFGYSFTGSLGVVLTMPKELMLLPGLSSTLDDAIGAVLRMAGAHDPQAVLEVATALGPAPVRALYKWADAHIQSGLGADIKWQRAGDVTAALLIQRPEMERLRRVLDTTSETEETEVEVTGDLVGADTQTRTFRLRNDEVEIRGRFEDAIGTAHSVELPKRYRARIRRTTRTYFSTDEDEVSYFLLHLTPA